MPGITELCTGAHRRLLPDVPLVGWDVALSAEHGPVLLELNISCNLFLGAVEEWDYHTFLGEHVSALQIKVGKVPALPESCARWLMVWVPRSPDGSFLSNRVPPGRLFTRVCALDLLQNPGAACFVAGFGRMKRYYAPPTGR